MIYVTINYGSSFTESFYLELYGVMILYLGGIVFSINKLKSGNNKNYYKYQKKITLGFLVAISFLLPILFNNCSPSRFAFVDSKATENSTNSSLDLNSLNCFFIDKIVRDGDSITAWNIGTATDTISCQSELRVCNKHQLSGSYTYSSCSKNSEQQCAAGTGLYCDSNNNNIITSCTNAPLNSAYTGSGGTSNNCPFKCNNDSLLNKEGKCATPCSATAGSFCPSSTSTPQLCPAGYTCAGDNGSTTAMTQPVICPVGNYCPAGSSTPIQCSPASACPTTGNTLQPGNVNPIVCTTAPAGFYCSSSSSQPQVCPVGFYCLGGSATSQPIACGPGFNCPAGTSSAPVCNAQAGTYCPSTLSQPQTCPAGNYCPGGIAAGFITCPIGNFCVSGSSSPMGCTAGYLCTSVGLSSLPSVCSEGYQYSNNNGCTLKPVPQVCQATAGNYCPVGSTTIIQCAAGNYCQGGTNPSQSCPSGYYCPNSANPPIACAEGFDCTTTGLSYLPSTCLQDYQYTNGSCVKIVKFALKVANDFNLGKGSIISSSSPNTSIGINLSYDGTGTSLAYYSAGTQVTLTAISYTGSVFSGWLDENNWSIPSCPNENNKCVVTMDKAKTVKANFSEGFVQGFYANFGNVLINFPAYNNQPARTWNTNFIDGGATYGPLGSTLLVTSDKPVYWKWRGYLWNAGGSNFPSYYHTPNTFISNCTQPSTSCNIPYSFDNFCALIDSNVACKD